MKPFFHIFIFLNIAAIGLGAYIYTDAKNLSATKIKNTANIITISKKVSEEERIYQNLPLLLAEAEKNAAMQENEIEPIRGQAEKLKNDVESKTNKKADIAKSIDSRRHIVYPPGKKRAALFSLDITAPLTGKAVFRSISLKDELFDSEGGLQVVKDAGGFPVRSVAIDFDTFELWDESKLLSKNTNFGDTTFVFNDIKFDNLNYVIPAGETRRIIFRAHVAGNAKLGNRHAISFGGYSLSTFALADTLVQIAPFIDISNEAKPSVRLTTLSYDNSFLKIGETNTIHFSVLNAPKNAKIALVLESSTHSQIQITDAIPADSNSYKWTVPKEDCKATGTNCFPFSPGNYNIKLILYQGDKFCLPSCMDSGKPVVLSMDTSESFYDISKNTSENTSDIDLVVSNINISPNPMKVGEPVTIKYTIKNVGSEKVVSGIAKMSVKNISNGWDTGGYGGITLAPGTSFEQTERDSDPYFAVCTPEGDENEIQAIVDVDNVVRETDEMNNSKSVVVKCFE